MEMSKTEEFKTLCNQLGMTAPAIAQMLALKDGSYVRKMKCGQCPVKQEYIDAVRKMLKEKQFFQEMFSAKRGQNKT